MCDPTLITLLKMQPHYRQSSRENTSPSSGTSPLASYKEVPPSPPGVADAKAVGSCNKLLLPQGTYGFHTTRGHKPSSRSDTY